LRCGEVLSSMCSNSRHASGRPCLGSAMRCVLKSRARRVASLLPPDSVSNGGICVPACGRWRGGLFLVQALMDEAPWRQSEVIMFGKPVPQPRRIAYMADDSSLSYTYTGSKMIVEPWHPDVATLRVRCPIQSEPFGVLMRDVLISHQSHQALPDLCVIPYKVPCSPPRHTVTSACRGRSGRVHH
jgi:hypothetical protein